MTGGAVEGEEVVNMQVKVLNKHVLQFLFCKSSGECGENDNLTARSRKKIEKIHRFERTHCQKMQGVLSVPCAEKYFLPLFTAIPTLIF